jgi:nitrate reductase beta subunit
MNNWCSSQPCLMISYDFRMVDDRQFIDLNSNISLLALKYVFHHTWMLYLSSLCDHTVSNCIVMYCLSCTVTSYSINLIVLFCSKILVYINVYNYMVSTNPVEPDP